MLRLAGRENLVRRRRQNAIPLVINGDTIVIKDQAPLIFANAALAPEWSQEDLVAYLNRHVYFLPGDFNGCAASGARFRSHYLQERPAILRIRTADLLAANRDQTPLFCPFNAGAPRKWGGTAAPRGPDLFQSAAQFSRTAGRVVELVFCSTVKLPAMTELSMSSGVWTNPWARPPDVPELVGLDMGI